MSENQIIPSLCGNTQVPFMDYESCKDYEPSGMATVLFEDGHLVINLPFDRYYEYISLHGADYGVYPALDIYNNYDFGNSADVLWTYDTTLITSVEIASPIQPVSTAYWFDGCDNMVTADMTNLDTSNTVSMHRMFARCSSLPSLDLSMCDTANVEDFKDMFRSCATMDTLDLSNWTFKDNTPEAWRDYTAYYHLPSLTTFILENVDTTQMTTMQDMFRGLVSLTALDLSSFNTDNVTIMAYMFSGCEALVDIIFPDDLDTSNVEVMVGMFASCSALRGLDLSDFNTENVEGMTNMFSDCTSLTELSLCSFNTQNVMAMDNMFYGCSLLESIYVTASTFFVPIHASTMFYGCTSLVGGMGTAYDPDHVDGEYARVDGTIGNEGYFTACYFVFP